MLLKSQVKYIQSLGQKKFRDEEAVFIAEGPKIVNELLQSPRTSLVNLFATREWMNANPRVLASLSPGQLIEIEESYLKRISGLSTPNQLLGIFKKPITASLVLQNRVSLVLDNIQDPGNLGTMIRIADWFAVRYIVCSEHSVDAFNPKVVQSSMGSICRVEVFYKELKSFFSQYADIPRYATVLDGENVFTMRPLKVGLILIGNESQGISPELLKMSHHTISIPRKGEAESLNAAIAAGIILSHLT